ncbi:MAG: MBL fold metallo-hydrolase [Clostridia bacterium]|nr:MBL fold metallo-hydrolase [Clostridia bacterium]
MRITYLGHACFLIEGRQRSVVTDPHKDIGYDLERVKADYCTVSHLHFDHCNVEGVDAGEIITASHPEFLAIDTYHDGNLGSLRGKNTVFKFKIDGITFCHLGDLGEFFSQDLVDEIGEVDVLFIPVGGTYTIDGREAVKYANAISAKITVPMHYSTPRSQVDVSDVSVFAKRMAGVERVDSSAEIDCYLSSEESCVLIFNTDKF